MKIRGLFNLIYKFAYINLNKDLEAYNQLGSEIYNDYRSKLELDSINLLYVVLTRSIDQLYIVSECDLDKAGNEKQKLYSGLFINYLKSLQLWDLNQFDYVFGNPIKTLPDIKINETLIQSQFISTSRQEHNLNILTNAGYLWDTAQEKAIEKGNLIHLVMSHIKTENDIEFVFEHLIGSGKLNQNQANELKLIVNAIVNHIQLKQYFQPNLLIYNEKDIITAQGEIVRPDRIIIDKNKAVILDYKTGAEDQKHKEQLNKYQKALEDMSFEVVKKILVYINNDIQIKEF